MSTEEERIQAAYERGFKAGWDARGKANAENPAPAPQRGWTDDRKRYHPPGCGCEICDGPG